MQRESKPPSSRMRLDSLNEEVGSIQQILRLLGKRKIVLGAQVSVDGRHLSSHILEVQFLGDLSEGIARVDPAQHNLPQSIDGHP